MSIPGTALFLTIGLVWWTLLEYLLHRFVFHLAPKSLGRRHLEHHDAPLDRRLAVASPGTSIGGAVLHGILFVGLFGMARGIPLLLGLVAGYLAYEWIHFSTHFRHPKTRWGKALRFHHLLHHHAQKDARFGVTSALWDRVFGTLPPPPVGRSPAEGHGRPHLRRTERVRTGLG